MLLLALLAAAAQQTPEPGSLKGFGDWAVACDNRHTCEMTSLQPEDPIPDGDEWGGSFSIARAAGPDGGFTVEITSYHELSGEHSVRVDGEVITGGMPKGETITFRGAAAAKIVAAMVNGKLLQLTDIADGLDVLTSLTGSSAALRFMDAAQGRAGTITAAVARGAKPASAVPAAVAAPVVRYVRPGGKAEPVGKTLRASLDKQSDCGSEYEGNDGGPPPVDVFALGGGKTLALLPCGAGAYNYSTVPFIVGGGKAVPATFDWLPDYAEGGTVMLVNASFDARGATLSTFNKGRGIGDCGDAQDYVWDGAQFRLAAARRMDECRASVNWLTVWKAAPQAQ
jgi:hypothetical protein